MEQIVVGFLAARILMFGHRYSIFWWLRCQSLGFRRWHNVPVSIHTRMILFIVLIFNFTIRRSCFNERRGCRWGVHRVMCNDRRWVHFVRTCSGLIQLHAVTVRIDVSPAMFTSLFDENLFSWSQCAQEALINGHIQALSIRVNYVIFRPLAKALIFTL